MSQLWTIIFVTLFAIGFGLAAWQDHEYEKRRKRQRGKDVAYESRDRSVK
jgi:hypothetical protein